MIVKSGRKLVFNYLKTQISNFKIWLCDDIDSEHVKPGDTFTSSVEYIDYLTHANKTAASVITFDDDNLVMKVSIKDLNSQKTKKITNIKITHSGTLFSKESVQPFYVESDSSIDIDLEIQI